MKQLFYLNALLLLVFPFACKEKPSSIYENCCGTEPTADAFLIQGDTFDSSNNLLDSVFTAQLYIPNIFTPEHSASGINDVFMIFWGKGVAEIQSAVFSSENGEIFFSQTSFAPNEVAQGWNGKKSDGTFYYGPFNYNVKVRYIDGQIKTYTGKACSYKCGDSDFPNDRLPDCFFPNQNNGLGAPDQSRPIDNACF